LSAAADHNHVNDLNDDIIYDDIDDYVADHDHKRGHYHNDKPHDHVVIHLAAVRFFNDDGGEDDDHDEA
jgi:hypothetical protein